MPRWFCKIFLLSLAHTFTLLLLLTLCSAQLFVVKHYERSHQVYGEPVVLEYRMLNPNEHSLHNIEIRDSTFHVKNFKKITEENSLPFRLAEMKPRQSHVHRVVLEIAETGIFVDKPAAVKYDRPKKPSATKDAGADALFETTSQLSAARGAMQILTQEEYNIHVVPHEVEWAGFLLAAALIVGYPSFRHYKIVRQISSLL